MKIPVMSNDAVVRISLNTDDIIFAAQQIIAQTTSEFLPTLIGVTTLVFIVIAAASFCGSFLSLCLYKRYTCCCPPPRRRRYRPRDDEEDDDVEDREDSSDRPRPPKYNANSYPQNETFL